MILRALLKTLVLPPAASLFLALFAFLVWWRWPRLARASLMFSIISLWVLSLPITGALLMGSLESRYPPLASDLQSEQIATRAGVIVVLGGGRRVAAGEYGEDTVSSPTLERLRFAAQIHRATELPILVTGGRVLGHESVSEAQLMARVLRDEFGVPVRWLEVNSRTTAENAVLSAALLERQDINSALLVTHAWHMPRSVWAFEQVGLKVIPAPMGFSIGGSSQWWMAWLPSAHALLRVHYALHEILGAWAYRNMPLISTPQD
ncbi:MAG: YdcF family protein [Cellvibrionaceae bacterium]